jgi:hypothetical protein
MSIKFKNSHIINELEVRCLITENEYNYSLNPTLQTGSFGDLKDFALDPNFTPYITTIGLYNDVNELLIVAKLGQPTQISPNTDTTFIIKLDI